MRRCLDSGLGTSHTTMMVQLPKLSAYTFGSMSLGHEPIQLEADIAVARAAMDAGVSFHSSPTYNNGFTFMILRLAFDEARSQRPTLIIKIRDALPRRLRFEIEDSLRRLGVDRLDIIQLVNEPGRPQGIATGFLERDERWDLVQKFKQEGKIGAAVLFLSKAQSAEARPALETGLFDGVTFYNNLLEQDVSDDLYQFIGEMKNIPVLSLRSVFGGVVARAATEPAQVAVSGKLERLRAIALKHGCADLVELSMRFGLSHANVRTTIGGTKNRQHLDRFLALASSAKPLPADSVREIEKLRREP